MKNRHKNRFQLSNTKIPRSEYTQSTQYQPETVKQPLETSGRRLSSLLYTGVRRPRRVVSRLTAGYRPLKTHASPAGFQIFGR